MNSKFAAVLALWPNCIAAGPWLFCSGQKGARPRDGLPCASYDDVRGLAPGAGSEYSWIQAMEAPVGAQALAIYERYRKLLAADGGIGNLVRYHIYQRDKRFFPVFDRVRRHQEKAPPASTAVGVGRLDPDDETRLCVDAIAFRPSGMPAWGARTVLGGSGRHAAAAHFSHVIGAGPYLFIAGQIPIDTSQPGAPLIRGYNDVPEEGRFLSVGRSHEDARNGVAPPRAGLQSPGRQCVPRGDRPARRARPRRAELHRVLARTDLLDDAGVLPGRTYSRGRCTCCHSSRT